MKKKTIKTIIVAGGMGSVGSACAKRLAKDGYRIVLLYHKASVGEVKKFLASMHGTGHKAYACDIGDSNKVARVMKKILSETRDIYGYIHSVASPIVRKVLIELDVSEFREQYQVEVEGLFNMIKHLAPALIVNKQGVIIAITSIFIENNKRSPRMGAYITSKYALRGLMRELSHELAPYNIRVNAVAPSMMKTKLSKDLPDKVFDFARELNPMKTLLTPDELAKTISFLCSENAAAITGISLPVAYGDTSNL